jgi:arylsulfatase A-like enzyme
VIAFIEIMKKTPIARFVPSLFALLLCAATPVSAQERPNIIIVLADDLGWGDVGFNGCREIPTLNLDALARSGVVFTSGYASHPYCSPSRAGLLTGRYAQRFGHEANPGAGPHDGLPLDQTLLSNVLKEHGYQNGIIGKWHLGDDPKFWPTRRGFDYWYGFSSGAMSYWGDTGQRDPMRGVLRNGQVVLT